ncbi:MAG: hydrazine synthase subunit beta [Candidatus Scalindua sp.]
MKKKFLLLSFIGAGLFGLALAQSANAGFIQGTRVRTDSPSPFHVAVSPDGGTLAIANQSGHSVTFIDTRSRKVTGEVPVQVQPEASVFTLDGRTLFVCNAESDTVSVIDVGNKAVVKTIKVGDWPCSIKLSKDGSKAYVTCSGSMWDTVDIIDTATNSKIGEIKTTDYGPRDIAISPDGKTAAVCLDTTGKINRGVDFIDLATGKVIEHRNIYQSANLRGVAYTPDGAFVLVTMEQPKNWLPVCEAENAQIFSNNLAVIETKKGGKVACMPLDEHNNYDGNPYGLAVDPDGKYVYIGIRGMHRVTILDLEKLISIVVSHTQEELDDMKNDLTLMVDYLVTRVNVGLGPSSVALSPDGKILYAANYFSNNISVIQTPVD